MDRFRLFGPPRFFEHSRCLAVAEHGGIPTLLSKRAEPHVPRLELCSVGRLLYADLVTTVSCDCGWLLGACFWSSIRGRGIIRVLEAIPLHPVEYWRMGFNSGFERNRL
jgi:hypothetical protein